MPPHADDMMHELILEQLKELRQDLKGLQELVVDLRLASQEYKLKLSTKGLIAASLPGLAALGVALVKFI